MIAHWRNRFGVLLPTSCGNIMLRTPTWCRGDHSLCFSFFDKISRPLLTNSKRFGSFSVVGYCGSSGNKRTTWFSTLFIGQWRNFTRLCGMLSSIMNRIDWQRTLKDLENAPDVAYVLRMFGEVWCVKALIATKSNLVVTWKVRPKIGTSTYTPGVPWWIFPMRWFCFWFLAIDSFQFIPKKKKEKQT